MIRVRPPRPNGLGQLAMGQIAAEPSSTAVQMGWRDISIKAKWEIASDVNSPRASRQSPGTCAPVRAFQQALRIGPGGAQQGSRTTAGSRGVPLPFLDGSDAEFLGGCELRLGHAGGAPNARTSISGAMSGAASGFAAICSAMSSSVVASCSNQSPTGRRAPPYSSFKP
jgi:hypothetical protein